MKPLKKDSKIYISCPAGVASGGPELLHQLCDTLRKHNVQAFMYYYPINHENPLHKDFREYNAPFVSSVEDEDKNLLIVPEVKTDLIRNFKRIQKVIWWLSVDHYINKFIEDQKKVKEDGYSRPLRKFYHFGEDEKVTHFVQSEFARQFLLTNHVNKKDIYYLSDYINVDFIENSIDYSNKKDYVVYNPKKIGITKKIIPLMPNLQWTPIQNMSRIEVADLLRNAKLYVDFGAHPGKDRIPREAAISGCCVITGRSGSAKFKEDVGIDDQYKFDDTDENILQIANKIRDVLNNFEIHTKNFDSYRRKIRSEKRVFEESISKIFFNESIER